MLRAEDDETKKYIAKMKEMKEELVRDLNTDDTSEGAQRIPDPDGRRFFAKFGKLKKASILAYYGREMEAKKIIAEAATMAKDQKAIESQRQEAIENRWKFKLGVDFEELPETANIKKKRPEEITDADLKEVTEQGTPLATVRLYIQKVSPFNHDSYGKNVFLDKCIEQLYMELEGRKGQKRDDIEKLKKHIEKLEEEAEYAEDGLEPEEDEMDAKKKSKSKHKKEKDSPKTMNKKIANLKTVVMHQSRALKEDKVREAFKPGNKNVEMDSKFKSTK